MKNLKRRKYQRSGMSIGALLVLLALSACSMLATKEAAIGCQVSDIATSYRALHLNSLAYEANPIPIPILLALKVAIIVWVWRHDHWDQESEGGRAAITVIGCAPIPGNLKAAKG